MCYDLFVFIRGYVFLAIVQKKVAISKCSSMPEWHTVEMASTVHGDHISGIKVKAYPETTLCQKYMFGIWTNIDILRLIKNMQLFNGTPNTQIISLNNALF